MTARVTKLLVPLAASALLLTACSGGDQPSGEGSGPSGGAGSAALVVAQGGLGDESFNDLAYAGFTRGVEAAGMTGTPIESADIVGQGEQILRRAAQTDAGLVIDLEYSHNELLPAVAADFPDTSWVLVNAEAAGENVASVLFQEQEGSYLAGALAAMVTQDPDNPHVNPDKVIGVIGGTESVGIDKFIVGFIQGAHDVDPDVQVLTAYSNDFADPAKGQQLAQSMYDQGADIVYAVAGGTGAGVIQAAVDNDRYAIGVDDDQDGVAPGNVLTSVLKRTDVAMEDVVARYAAGEFPGGETVTYGLADGGVGLTDYEYTKDDIGQDTIDAVDALADQIVSGDITVWNAVTQGYPDFYGN
ncbi:MULTISPECIES: BMP family ABC transporter substrate-binding protein [unclassified Cellulomonas]|uniref:BMP family lipoprotein n=1 Tax=unclassified Cellulomonas TaxID=2620175 RepID=UPI0019A72F9D|nr:BMP family ABC transporter substrate-binding protein [Cellulomonas sp. ES6]MBD3780289.1 BMP family ABC transporter substrate-binding protein [Micrococcales bacterium]WHP16984.1 BMP family ABC transporter substrate-binding protein [Cellulomonas sp. ES6]